MGYSASGRGKGPETANRLATRTRHEEEESGMVLISKNRRLLALVRNAYSRAQVAADQVLVVSESRIYLHESLIVVESVCPADLAKIMELLRIFTGEHRQPLGQFIGVRAVG